MQDVQLRAPIYGLEDIARIKDALAIEGEQVHSCILGQFSLLKHLKLANVMFTLHHLIQRVLECNLNYLFAGVYNVICDIPEQTVVVSTRLSPHTITSLVRRVMGEATLINVVDPYSTSGALVLPPIDRTRYSSYDDMYSYPSSSGYTPAYDPYNGRSYDNEFRPSHYYTGSSYY